MNCISLTSDSCPEQGDSACWDHRKILNSTIIIINIGKSLIGQLLSQSMLLVLLSVVAVYVQGWILAAVSVTSCLVVFYAI